MGNHTPTPWAIDGFHVSAVTAKKPDGTWRKVADCSSYQIGGQAVEGSHDEDVANAAIIKRAVNSYALLVEALHAIIQLDHHNMAPESQVTKMARAALNAVEPRHGQ